MIISYSYLLNFDKPSSNIDFITGKPTKFPYTILTTEKTNHSSTFLLYCTQPQLSCTTSYYSLPSRYENRKLNDGDNRRALWRATINRIKMEWTDSHHLLCTCLWWNMILQGLLLAAILSIYTQRINPQWLSSPKNKIATFDKRSSCTS